MHDDDQDTCAGASVYGEDILALHGRDVDDDILDNDGVFMSSCDTGEVSARPHHVGVIKILVLR